MSFQGFHFRGQHGPDSGQVLLEGMNDDIRLRYCFFDGRDNWTTGIRTRYNSTNRASVEDSAFLQNWRAIVWYFGTINVNHSVFDVSIFSDIYLLRRATALRVENSVSTSANARNSHAFGHLIIAEDHEHIH